MTTARNFGFSEVMTPTFENTDLFIARSGPEIVDEMYEFEDKGGRRIALRPEITASVIRYYVNELQTRPKPLKLYYMGNCFRYERPQSGRYREFFQFGAEIVGSPSLSSDAEVLALASSCLRGIGLKNVKMRVGHLGILKGVFEEMKLDEIVQTDIRRLVDKRDFEELGTLAAESDISDENMDRLVDLVSLKGGAEAIGKAKEVLGRADPSLNYLSRLLERLALYGVGDAEIDLGVARGLDYYSGMVFEIDAPSLGAEKQVCGGGSYTLSEVFGGEEVFSTGFAFGFDRLMLAMENDGVDIPSAKLETYVIPVSDTARAKCILIVSELRNAGVSADIDLMGRKMGKALAYADSLNFRTAIIVGENELEDEKATVRDMASGEQESVPFAELARYFCTEL